VGSLCEDACRAVIGALPILCSTFTGLLPDQTAVQATCYVSVYGIVQNQHPGPKQLHFDAITLRFLLLQTRDMSRNVVCARITPFPIVTIVIKDLPLLRSKGFEHCKVELLNLSTLVFHLSLPRQAYRGTKYET